MKYVSIIWWITFFITKNLFSGKFLWLLKGSCDNAKKLHYFVCNTMCLYGLRLKKHIIFHILYTIVALLHPAFLKRIDFYKAHRSEKRGLLWLASYPACCDWPNTQVCDRNVTPLTIFGNSQLSPQNGGGSNNSIVREKKWFLCVNIWVVLCKSSNTLMWGCV